MQLLDQATPSVPDLAQRNERPMSHRPSTRRLPREVIEAADRVAEYRRLSSERARRRVSAS